MDRKFKSGAAVAPPNLDNASDGYFTAGNPSGGVPATKPGPHWYHMVTEEMLSVIAAAGIAFDKTNIAQLLTAIQTLSNPEDRVPVGRITLTTGLPVTTGDVSGAGTVYYTPHEGERIHLYDGTRWVWKTFAELSQATTDNTKSPAAVANNSNYDLFVWNDAGTMRCTRGPAWSSLTARGAGAGTTELELFNGKWVNKVNVVNGPLARRGRYVGSVNSNGSALIDDTFTRRCVWNLNGVARPLRGAFSAGRATASATYVELNSEIRVAAVVGLPFDAMLCAVSGQSLTDDAGNTGNFTSLGLDNTTALDVFSITGFGGEISVGRPVALSMPIYTGIGFHYVTVLGRRSGAGNSTWIGAAPGSERTTLNAVMKG